MISQLKTSTPTLDDLILSHAAGHLPASLSIMIDCHVELRPDNRQLLSSFEAIGGMLLERQQEPAFDQSQWIRFEQRLQSSLGHAAESTGDHDDELPRSLSRAIGCRLDQLTWEKFGPVHAAHLNHLDEDNLKAKLISLKRDRTVPSHTHEGLELILVLKGSFSDLNGEYRRGDIVIADANVDHRPKAGAEADCLCYVVQSGPLKLTGPLGRWMNPFLKTH